MLFHYISVSPFAPTHYHHLYLSDPLIPTNGAVDFTDAGCKIFNMPTQNWKGASLRVLG